MNITSINGYNPSFGKVIPIKKIVFDDDSTVRCEQMSLDIFESQNNEKLDSSCDQDLAKKVIQSLNRILTKNDGAENNTYKNALNNMIRTVMAQMDKDYKAPTRPVDSSHNELVKPCYTTFRNYILTGKEASEYAVSGRNIGGARALVRDFDESEYVIDKSKRSFANCKEDLTTDPKVRLKNQYGGNLGLVIYADKIDVPKKGHKGSKTEINIKGIDFEPV